MTSHNEFRLTEEILALSNSQTWGKAKTEWGLVEVYREDDPMECLCGHYPINEICVIRNAVTGNEAIVGNVCVKKFLGLPSTTIFDAIRRIADDISRALNEDAAQHAFERGWINRWERDFYLDTWRKRNLSDKQRRKRIEINERVLRNTVNRFNQRTVR